MLFSAPCRAQTSDAPAPEHSPRAFSVEKAATEKGLLTSTTLTRPSSLGEDHAIPSRMVKARDGGSAPKTASERAAPGMTPEAGYFFRSSLTSTATSWATQLVSFQPSPTLKSKRLIVIVPANFAAAPEPVQRELHRHRLRRALQRELAVRDVRAVGGLLDLLRLELRLRKFLGVEPVLVEQRRVAIADRACSRNRAARCRRCCPWSGRRHRDRSAP